MASYKKIKYVFDPIGDVKVLNKDAVLKDIADLVKDEILSHVSQGKSPVLGEGTFARLSTEYKDREKFGNPIANLDLSGEMLNKLKVIPKNGKIEVSVDGSSKRLLGRVEGHNQHDNSLAHPLPKRRFIPKENQKWRQAISSEIKNIVSEEAERYEAAEARENSLSLQDIVDNTLTGIRFVYGNRNG